MSKILLSFIIPTYNRPGRIENIINQIISFQSDEIEIVIGDDNPSFEKTQEVVTKFTDPRIKYFKNKKNLGPELNTLKIIKRANGKFITIMVDEDDFEMKTVPWILKTLKENNNITQLCGTIEYIKKSSWGEGIYFEFGDGILKQGTESLKKLLFYYEHGTGIIYKKEVIDVYKALKYINQISLLHFLIGQACIAGDTLCTSKTLAYTGRTVGGHVSCRPSINGRSYWHALNRLIVEKTRIKILYYFTEKINDKELRKHFLVKEKQRIFHLLNLTRLESFKSFLEGIKNTISNIKPSRSLRFWIEYFIDVLFKFCIKKLKRSQNKYIEYLVYHLGRFLDNKIYNILY